MITFSLIYTVFELFRNPFHWVINPNLKLGFHILIRIGERSVYNLCEFLGFIILHFSVDIHRHLAVFVSCQILHRSSTLGTDLFRDLV